MARSPASAESLVEQLRPYIRDERVLAAIATVPRHLFVPGRCSPGMGNTALPIGAGQTISQPVVVARMCELLELTGDETVLDVGTGSGYHAARAWLSSRAQVWSIERKPELAEQARRNLAAAGIDERHLSWSATGRAGFPSSAVRRDQRGRGRARRPAGARRAACRRRAAGCSDRWARAAPAAAAPPRRASSSPPIWTRCALCRWSATPTSDVEVAGSPAESAAASRCIPTCRPCPSLRCAYARRRWATRRARRPRPRRPSPGRRHVPAGRTPRHARAPSGRAARAPPPRPPGGAPVRPAPRAGLLALGTRRVQACVRAVAVRLLTQALRTARAAPLRCERHECEHHDGGHDQQDDGCGSHTAPSLGLLHEPFPVSRGLKRRRPWSTFA